MEPVPWDGGNPGSWSSSALWPTPCMKESLEDLSRFHILLLSLQANRTRCPGFPQFSLMDTGMDDSMLWGFPLPYWVFRSLSGVATRL